MPGLFGPEVGPAPVDDDLRALAQALAPTLRMGTSSWTFPGWQGVVWDRPASKPTLVSEGLAAYAAHPMLRTVGVDRTYYGPVDARTFAGWAEQVPPDFRFLVKAHERVTTVRFPRHKRYGALGGRDNPAFLDPEYAIKYVVEPSVSGLGDRLGALLFQFPPTPAHRLGRPEALAERLDAFFAALPVGPRYAVELRTNDWLTPAYSEVLLRHQVRHSYVVHPTMPPLAEQIRRVRGGARHGLVIRWMLRSGWAYDDAVAAFTPFTERRAPDEPTQSEVARLIGLALGRDKEVIVIVNNKAEGSAPWSIIELGKRLLAAGG